MTDLPVKYHEEYLMKKEGKGKVNNAMIFFVLIVLEI